MNKLLIALLAAFSINNAFAQTANPNKNADMVMATVNNQAITLQELKDRITLTKLLVNRQLSASEFDTLKSQAIEQLVNEELKRQYAKEKKIVIKPEELNKAITFIEKQRGLAAGTLVSTLPEQLRTTALEQIKDSILQQKIIQQVIARKVFVPDYQVQTLLDNVINQAETKEYKISQLKVPATNSRAKDAQNLNKIHKQLVSGEKFDKLVAAYSVGENKLQGGLLGWFSLAELDFKLQNEVSKLAKGEFSKPIKMTDSWVILKVDDIKSTKHIDTSETVEYKFVLFKSAKLSDDAIRKITKKLKDINSFSQFEALKEELKEKYKFTVDEDIDWVSLDKIPEQDKNNVLETLPSNFSQVFIENNTMKFVYLLDVRTKRSQQLETIENRIRRNLENAQAERKFKQFAKQLRANSFVEIR